MQNVEEKKERKKRRRKKERERKKINLKKIYIYNNFVTIFIKVSLKSKKFILEGELQA
tara:strand:- start:697 stop:870 length:174 start_codon:yes stop_codon:yes gene_type:complete